MIAEGDPVSQEQRLQGVVSIRLMSQFHPVICIHGYFLFKETICVAAIQSCRHSALPVTMPWAGRDVASQMSGTWCYFASSFSCPAELPIPGTGSWTDSADAQKWEQEMPLQAPLACLPSSYVSPPAQRPYIHVPSGGGGWVKYMGQTHRWDPQDWNGN